MNRILQYLDSCPCCRAEKLSEKWRNVADHLEATIGDNLVTASYPGPSIFLDRDAKEIEISFLFRDVLTLKPISSLDEASGQTVNELRRVADLLLEAADRLEGGAG